MAGVVFSCSEEKSVFQKRDKCIKIGEEPVLITDYMWIICFKIIDRISIRKSINHLDLMFDPRHIK